MIKCAKCRNFDWEEKKCLIFGLFGAVVDHESCGYFKEIEEDTEQCTSSEDC